MHEYGPTAAACSREVAAWMQSRGRGQSAHRDVASRAGLVDPSPSSSRPEAFKAPAASKHPAPQANKQPHASVNREDQASEIESVFASEYATASLLVCSQ